MVALQNAMQRGQTSNKDRETECNRREGCLAVLCTNMVRVFEMSAAWAAVADKQGMNSAWAVSVSGRWCSAARPVCQRTKRWGQAVKTIWS